MDLEKFLREREGEWWSPHEIGKDQKVDIRTVKKRIKRLKKMVRKGWSFDVAERGDRLYCVRLVRDIESSSKLNKVKVLEKGQTPLVDYPHAI